MLIEDIKEEDLWKYFFASGSLVVVHEIVKRHNRKREQIKERGRYENKTNKALCCCKRFK